VVGIEGTDHRERRCKRTTLTWMLKPEKGSWGSTLKTITYTHKEMFSSCLLSSDPKVPAPQRSYSIQTLWRDFQSLRKSLLQESILSYNVSCIRRTSLWFLKVLFIRFSQILITYIDYIKFKILYWSLFALLETPSSSLKRILKTMDIEDAPEGIVNTILVIINRIL